MITEDIDTPSEAITEALKASDEVGESVLQLQLIISDTI